MPSGMFDTPSSVTSLRRYWKNKNQLPDPGLLAIELARESDRAVVILTTSILDDMLKNLIARNLCIAPKPTPKQIDHIFRFDGPFGSLSSRTEVAFLFGLIDETTRSQLSELREMRNACAHSIQPLSFQTKELAAVARRILKSKIAPTSMLSTPHGMRIAFMTEFSILLQTLVLGTREAGLESVRDSLKKLFSDAGIPLPDTLA